MRVCKKCECQYGEHYKACPSCKSTSWKTLITKTEPYKEFDEVSGREVELLTVVMSEMGRFDDR
jgi:hypothetical protein